MKSWMITLGLILILIALCAGMTLPVLGGLILIKYLQVSSLKTNASLER